MDNDDRTENRHLPLVGPSLYLVPLTSLVTYYFYMYPNLHYIAIEPDTINQPQYQANTLGCRSEKTTVRRCHVSISRVFDGKKPVQRRNCWLYCCCGCLWLSLLGNHWLLWLSLIDEYCYGCGCGCHCLMNICYGCGCGCHCLVAMESNSLCTERLVGGVIKGGTTVDRTIS